MTENPKQRAGFIPELDGLRACAILAVLAAHSWEPLSIPWLHSLARFGWVGVDLFFVLSGFLITGILLDTAAEPHYFRNFYLRRALRIWPLYFALIAFMFLVAPQIAERYQVPELDFSAAHYKWWYYVIYLQNVLLRDLGPFPLAITWSLAIEEHFYLLWPMVVRFCSPSQAGSRRWLMRGLVVTIFLSPLIRWSALHQFQVAPFYLFSFTPFRLDGLAWGALLAWWMRSEPFSQEGLRRWSLVGCAVLGAALGWLAVLPEELGQKAAGLVWIYSLLAAGYAGVLGAALSLAKEKSWLRRLLRKRPLLYTGKISYGIYILHPLVLLAWWNSPLRLMLFAWKHNYWRDVADLAGGYMLLLAVTSASWYCFERPILKWKDRIAGRGAW